MYKGVQRCARPNDRQTIHANRMYEVRGTMRQTNHAYRHTNTDIQTEQTHSCTAAQPQKHNGTNAQRHKRHGMTYPIARQSRPASAPSSQGQPRPARPAHAQHPACAARRPALCTLRCVPRPALCASPCSAPPGRCPGPCGAVCGCAYVFVCSARTDGRADAAAVAVGVASRRCPSRLTPVVPPVLPGPVALWPSAPYSLASSRLVLPLWRSVALALGHGGRIRRGARGAGALRPGCWCRCPT